MKKKSVISLISYDAAYLPESISKYYNYVDEIVLGVDKNRTTWSGNSFSFDENKLWSELGVIDGDSKISIVEEDFVKSKIAIENDNYERNFLKAQCTNDWIFSIDADEYLVNSKDFFYNYCPLVERYYNKADICMTWATPYKTIEDTTLVIANEDGTPFFGENQGMTTSKDSTFTYARWSDKSAAGHNRLLSPLVAIHWSLCRNKEDLHQKINNIGHSDIVENDPFYQIWDQVTMDNYEELHNFKSSGLGTAQWPILRAVPSEQVVNYIEQHLDRAY
tara:strand:+ start:100 stop:930 length:831 start_codon:yes stop_codon:yes gene_type:complete